MPSSVRQRGQQGLSILAVPRAIQQYHRGTTGPKTESRCAFACTITMATGTEHNDSPCLWQYSESFKDHRTEHQGSPCLQTYDTEDHRDRA